jgi:Cd2+/Zn2+-exporting ATPase
MTRLVFKIQGMDCPEEVAVLRRAVGPVVGGADRLSCDLLNGTMTVSLPEGTAHPGPIMQAVRKTGMHASLWQEEWPLGDNQATGKPWQRWGRPLLCLLSALCLGSGMGWQVLSQEHGLLAFIGSATPGTAMLPFASWLLYLGAIVSGAWYVVPKALYALRTVRPDMHVLMLVAVAGAMALGEWCEAATVAFLFALALLLESWSVERARLAIRALMDLAPSTARCLHPDDGGVVEQRVDTVPIGTTILVRPGEKIPLDGTVTQGDTMVNQSPITGEAVPVPKTVGDEVFAGTINGDSAFTFRTTKPASDTTLARIIHLVAEAKSRRAPREQWVERFARVYTPTMMVLAGLLATLPPLLGGGPWSLWVYNALVLLVIACPCALVLSTPVSIVAGLTAAARAGVLIKGGASLEAPARLRAIAFDKTGTLTCGQPTVQEVIPLHGHTVQELLTCAAALEAHSAHPLARAILQKAASLGLTTPPAEQFTALQGRGAEAVIHGKRFWIGSHRLMEDLGVEDAAFHALATRLEDAGHSLVAISTEEHICGLISVADGVRAVAAEAVRTLKRLGIAVIVMLTGDNRGTAQAVGTLLGVDQVHAELLPADKVTAIEALRHRYGEIAMVGDGVNDAPAMAAATLGIAMGAIGTAAAMETADITLMSDDLTRLAWLVGHARRTLRVIQQNIVCALGLKLLFILLAVTGVATLWMAIAADMGASLLVMFNGLRLMKRG